MIQEVLNIIFNQVKTKKKIQTSVLQENLNNIKAQGEKGGFLKRGKRRSKKNKEERSFICGCGKDYLSYPALYTHIKNKHNKIPPEGTSLPQNKINQTKISDSKMGQSEFLKDNSMDDNFSLISENKLFEEDKKLIDLDEYDRSFKNFDLLDNHLMRGKTNNNLLFFKDVLNFYNNEYIEHPIKKYIKSLNNEDKGLDFSNCTQILAKFLYDLSFQCNEKFYSISVFIFQAFYECLNLYGYELILMLQNQNKKIKPNLLGTKDNKDFCGTENSKYIVITYDFFIKNFLPNYIKNVDIDLLFYIKYLLYFYNWLFERNLTKIKIDFNYN